MAGRYTLRSNEHIDNNGALNSYGGTRYMDEVEQMGEECASKLFGGRVSLKPLSGHIASLLMFASVCRRRDSIMAISSKDGGYDGYGRGYIPELFSVNFREIPFDRKVWNIKTEETAEAIRKNKPRLVILGQSFILFPYDVRAVSDACKEAGSLLAYDASHVLGLVAGARFQQPLKEGCDIMIGSTHKSFPGPQGGIFATTDDDVWKQFIRNTTWRIIDNAHWNRIAGLAQAMNEMSRHGRNYASRIQKNSKSLGSYLSKGGMKCLFGEQGYSESHQLHIDPSAVNALGMSFGSLSERLECSDIIVDTTGRFGTSEVSRLGMGDGEMKRIAGLIGETLTGRNVKRRVNKLRRSFKIQYA
jgi:glycine hydroxymethyltransferase